MHTVSQESMIRATVCTSLNDKENLYYYQKSIVYLVPIIKKISKQSQSYLIQNKKNTGWLQTHRCHIKIYTHQACSYYDIIQYYEYFFKAEEIPIYMEIGNTKYLAERHGLNIN